jgi:acetyl-CoA carboxylase biotin carboxyl carrier protein
MNIDQIRELAKIAKENNLESIELQSEDMTVKIKRPVVGTADPCAIPAASVQRTYEVTKEAVSKETVSAGITIETAHPFAHEIKSPMVGVYYSAPAPEKDPYVQVGSRVKKGDILCIIEAMKLMNEITADKDGEIVKICVENGQVVEFAQPLFQIA